MNVAEVWKPVVGYEGKYEVSDQGGVRSLDRSWLQRGRCGRNHTRQQPGKTLRPGPSKKSGHLSVVLGRGNTRHVHVLVLEVFVGPRPPSGEGRHLDGKPSNNRLSNLAWGTKGENMEDRARHGNYKITSTQVSEIRGSPKSGVLLSTEMFCSTSQISNIRTGKQRGNS